MFTSDGKLVLAYKGQERLLPMEEIRAAESRLMEVAIVNRHKAPELLATYNRAYALLGEHLIYVEMALNDALKAVASRKSIVILDEVPKILRAKSLSSARSPAGSEDLRQAVLDQDKEYLAAVDKADSLKALKQLLETKKEDFERGYTSVKKVLGSEPSWKEDGLGKNRNTSVPGETPERVETGMVSHPAFGRSSVG